MSLLLCLLGIGGHKIMAQNHIFTFLTSSVGGASYYARKLPKPRP